MIFKRRISFQLFVANFDAKYSHVIPYINKRNSLCGVEIEGIQKLKYRTVKDEIPALFKKGEIEKAIHKALNEYKLIKFGKGLSLRAVLKASNYEKMEFLLWLQNEYKKLKILEDNNLRSEPDTDWTNAGASKLDILGDFYLIDTLAVRYGRTHEQIRDWTYGRIFDIRLKDKLEREINKKYNEIKQKKRKKK